MKKMITRIFVTIAVALLIMFAVDNILKIKYRDKFNSKENKDWDWTKEDALIFEMINNKFPGEESEDFTLINMKNYNIPEKEDDEKRILVVGDSFVYGYSGTNVNYTWWKQLDLRIKEAGYSNINVYGTGRYFFNTKDELEKILKNDDLIKKINPDLIIIGYVSNDPEERNPETGMNLVKDVWEIDLENNDIYKKSPTLYYELVDRMNCLGFDEYDKIVEIGDRLGFYRWDARNLYIVQGERLERYKNILKEVDNTIKNLNIPYVYFFTDNIDNLFVDEANNAVLNAMKELSIEAFNPEYDYKKLLESINSTNVEDLNVNPIDSHPGIPWTYDYSVKAFKKLKEDYSFIFEDAKKEDLKNREININDTMPFLEVTKIKKNKFKFEYPKSENERTINSNFLYYPIEKEYVKLNLEYPKEISEIIIKGENIKEVELYVNEVDSEYKYDINEVRRKLTQCNNIGNNTFKINNKITSLNLVVSFTDEKNRNIEIEFAE